MYIPLDMLCLCSRRKIKTSCKTYLMSRVDSALHPILIGKIRSTSKGLVLLCAAKQKAVTKLAYSQEPVATRSDSPGQCVCILNSV